MINKKQARRRRAKRTRAHIQSLNVNRLSVHRTSSHIQAQLFAPDGKELVTISTQSKSLKSKLKNGGNIEAAKLVGEAIAQWCQEAGITEKIAFDRSGFKYHGRVKALAEAVRANGLPI